MPHLLSLPAIALVLTAFFIYARTAYPSLPGGDSGELIVAAHTLGLPHPPGYPLFAMVGHVFDRVLSFKEKEWSVAYRVNLVSGVCTAIAAWTVYAMVKHVVSRLLLLDEEGKGKSKGGDGGGGASTWIAVAAGGMYAFFPLVWTYALQVRGRV